ncbi:uro-adherence factor A [Antennarius striatus]|uniref:uro-adherence factor A n=1 Tax=Antennarius striatus TaxID=241820 RepID=UPI0035B24946
MEFWQGQSHPYSNFGAVPGRNYTQNYHDRYQATHYPPHYGERQDQGRETGYLTVARQRTEGVPQKSNSWMDQEMSAPSPSHFPFLCDSRPQQHQDLGEYQLHEVREKEWTSAQRGMRGYGSGFLREGWPRTWEACSPAHYNREVSVKRTDSSYRELEAWAARYSHSLPRKRRIEAELRGSSQGLLESNRAQERDIRSVTDPRVAALQHVIQSANIRESGLRDRGGRQLVLTSYASQTPTTGMSHTLDVKEKTGYIRRMVSHPPGYVAPPPYNSPHKSLPVLKNSDTSCEKEGWRQTYWSQPTLSKQDVSGHPRKGDKEDLRTTDVTQYIFSEFEDLKNQRHETDIVEVSSPVSSRKPHIQHEDTLSLQWPQTLLAAHGQKKNEEPNPKVIEGRKFRLSKKTGGLTIFCLVSRIAGTTGTVSLPLCTSDTSTEAGDVSKSFRDFDYKEQTFKFADEVDCRALTLSEQSNNSDVGNLNASQKVTQICDEKKLSNKAELATMALEKESTDVADRSKVNQPVSVKYPLWREPNFTSRAEIESSSTSLKANNEERESDLLKNQHTFDETHPTNTEVGTGEIKTDTKCHDNEGLLLIDTTCVVVKMELIPSPKKKQIHFFDHSPPDSHPNISPECLHSNSPLKQDVKIVQKEENKPIDERSEAELYSDLAERKPTDEENEISFPCMSSASGSEKEALEECAEEILVIPKHYSITEQESGRSLLDLCVGDQEPSPIDDNATGSAAEEITEGQSEIQVEIDQTGDVLCLKEKGKPEDNMSSDYSEAFAGSQEQTFVLSEENHNDSQLKTLTSNTNDSLESEMREHLDLRTTSVDDKTESGFIAHNAPEDLTHYAAPLSIPYSPSKKMSSSLPTGSENLSHSSVSHTDHYPDPSLDLINLPADAVSGVGEASETSPKINNEISEGLDVSQKDVLKQQFESGNLDNPPSVPERNICDENQTKEPNKDTIEPIVPVKSQDDGTKISILDQLECVQEKDVACVTRSSMAEEQLPKEVKNNPKGLMKAALSEETLTECQTGADIHHQQSDNSQEDDYSCPKEKYMTEEQSDEEANEDPAGVMEEMISRESNIDFQIEIEIENVQDTEPQTESSDSSSSPLDSPSELSQSSVDVISHSGLPSLSSVPNSDLEPTSVPVIDASLSSSDSPSDLNPVGDDEGDASLSSSDSPSDLNPVGDDEGDASLSSSDSPSDLNPVGHDEGDASLSSSDSPTDLNPVGDDEGDAPLSSSDSTSDLNPVGDDEGDASLSSSHSHSDLNPVGDDEGDASLSSSDGPSDLNPVGHDEGDASLSSSDSTSDLNPVGDDEGDAPLSSSDSTSDLNPVGDDEGDASLSSSHSHSDLNPVGDDEGDASPSSSDIPSDLNPVDDDAAATLEMVPSLVLLDSCKESSTPSSILLLPSITKAMLQEGGGHAPLDLTLKEEPQYPKSLWDAVNRIRKHTAPDSENEEEEASDLWDPVSAGKDLSGLNVVDNTDIERRFLYEAEQLELLSKGDIVDAAEVQKVPCGEEVRGDDEEDSLSSSSASSQSSEDTIVIADEDEFEEMVINSRRETKSVQNEESQVADNE